MAHVISRCVFGALLIAWSFGAVWGSESASLRNASNPDRWPAEERQRYLDLEYGVDRETRQRVSLNRVGRATKTMIAGTSGPFAIHAGAKVLSAGGSAADAALTTSLAQIAVSAGAAMSYAGVLTAVHYDAASGQVFTLDAGYNTVRAETSPRTIPGVGGRTALVPGFMAGVQALHDRFGTAPFASLFAPSIWIAEEGLVFSRLLQSWVAQSGDSLTRLPEGRGIFLKPDGKQYQNGDRFRQSELAATLRQVARDGARYMYSGDWAKRFVDVVQREGGAMTLKDLAAYEARWVAPYKISYRGREVVALGNSSNSGLMTLGALKIAEAVDLRRFGPGASSAQTLHYVTRAFTMAEAFVRTPKDARAQLYPGIETEPASLLTSETAQRFAARLEEAARDLAASSPSEHTGGVVAVDSEGNVTCIMHSINTSLWGKTGIFVGGVSIPDSAVIQRSVVADAGPGGRIRETPTTLLVLEGGRPVLATATISSSLYPVSIQSAINFLDFAMDPEQIVTQPTTHAAPANTVAVHAGDFDEQILEDLRKLGTRVQVRPRQGRDRMWIGIRIDAGKHELRGATSLDLPSMVEGS